MALRTMLVVDDEPSSVRLIQRLFERRNWVVHGAQDGRSAYEAFLQEKPDIVLLDLGLPDIKGMDLLGILRSEPQDAAVIMVTGRAELETAVEAMRLGAENFVAKPIRADHLEAVVERAYEKVILQRQNRALAEQQAGFGSNSADPLQTLSPVVRQQIDLMAGADTTVLLQGETGTGKSLVARMIHSRSARRSVPFVEVNCAALSPALLESELFGHEKGAFTDAKTQKRGLFEVADGGTLLLDEVGDLALELQPKLLTALETQRFRRLGGTREIEVDVRVITATNRDLAEDVQAGRFRRDLYYRIAVFPLQLPALRARTSEEILQLTYALLGELQKRLGRRPVRISDEVLRLLVRYPWPGNIRELRNILERCVINSRGEEVIRLRHVPPDISDRAIPSGRDGYDPTLTLEEVEKRHIARVLASCDGNRTTAAQILGISRRSIYDRMRRLGIAEP